MIEVKEEEVVVMATRKLQGAVSFEWVCPRCGHRQHVSIPAEKALYSEFVYCQNSGICGERESWILVSLDLAVRGSYQDSSDVPLAV